LKIGGVAVCVELLGPYENSAACIGATGGGMPGITPPPVFLKKKIEARKKKLPNVSTKNRVIV
jgi:hypothetical protein